MSWPCLAPGPCKVAGSSATGRGPQRVRAQAGLTPGLRLDCRMRSAPPHALQRGLGWSPQTSRSRAQLQAASSGVDSRTTLSVEEPGSVGIGGRPADGGEGTSRRRVPGRGRTRDLLEGPPPGPQPERHQGLPGCPAPGGPQTRGTVHPQAWTRASTFQGHTHAHSHTHASLLARQLGQQGRKQLCSQALAHAWPGPQEPSSLGSPLCRAA